MTKRLEAEFPVGAERQQWQGRTPIRRVRVIAVRDGRIAVRALYGPLKGMEYELQPNQLRRMDADA